MDVNKAIPKRRRKRVSSQTRPRKNACTACTKSKVKCVKQEGELKCILCTKRGCQCICEVQQYKENCQTHKSTQSTLMTPEMNFQGGLYVPDIVREIKEINTKAEPGLHLCVRENTYSSSNRWLEPVRKSSCTACTKSKVKCVKEEGELKCVLCIKRGCQCHFEARRQKESLTHQTYTQRTPKISEISDQNGLYVPEMMKEIKIVESKVEPAFYPHVQENAGISSNAWIEPVDFAEDNDIVFLKSLLEPEIDIATSFSPEVEEREMPLNVRPKKTVNSNEYPLDRLFYDFNSNLLAY